MFGNLHEKTNIMYQMTASDITGPDDESPPNNTLKALSGSYKGFYSIRVNDQWRISFKWSDNGKSLKDDF